MAKSPKPKRSSSEPDERPLSVGQARRLSPKDCSFGIGKTPRNVRKKASQTVPTDWDFSNVNPAELEACLCYEFARDSEKFTRLGQVYLANLKCGSRTGDMMHCKLISLNYRCAFLLKSLGPHFDLRKKTWEIIEPEIRRRAAEIFRNRPAFGPARAGDGVFYGFAMEGKYSNARGVTGWDGVNLQFQWGDELSLVHIDWTQPDSVIKKQCKAWLKEKIERRGARKSKGRHSNAEIRLADLLRGLGALRLLAHYSMEEAIKITTEKLNRPLFAGRSPWENAASSAAGHFHEEFEFEGIEMRSLMAYLDRRIK